MSYLRLIVAYHLRHELHITIKKIGIQVTSYEFYFHIRTYYVYPPLYNESMSKDEKLITVDVFIETTNNNLT